MNYQHRILIVMMIEIFLNLTYHLPESMQSLIAALDILRQWSQQRVVDCIWCKIDDTILRPCTVFHLLNHLLIFHV